LLVLLDSVISIFNSFFQTLGTTTSSTGKRKVDEVIGKGKGKVELKKPNLGKKK
jgi:hypothetical protein